MSNINAKKITSYATQAHLVSVSSSVLPFSVLPGTRLSQHETRSVYKVRSQRIPAISRQTRCPLNYHWDRPTLSNESILPNFSYIISFPIATKSLPSLM